MAKRTVTYFAKSIFVSKTFWINALAVAAEILTLTDTLQIVPPGYHGHFALLMGSVNIVLRRLTQRPARFGTKPGESEPVQVEKIKADPEDRMPPPSSFPPPPEIHK